MLKPAIIKLCGEIQGLSILITNATEHDVFVDYAAHVNRLGVRIIRGGWQEDADNSSRTENIEAKIDNEDSTEKLSTIKNELENMLSEIYTITIE